MVATREDVQNFVRDISNNDLNKLCYIINNTFLSKNMTYEEALKTFLEKMKAAEDAVARGEYKTSAEVHTILGV